MQRGVKFGLRGEIKGNDKQGCNRQLHKTTRLIKSNCTTMFRTLKYLMVFLFEFSVFLAKGKTLQLPTGLCHTQ